MVVGWKKVEDREVGGVCTKAVADLHSKIFDVSPPTPSTILFTFIGFSGNFYLIIGWLHL